VEQNDQRGGAHNQTRRGASAKRTPLVRDISGELLRPFRGGAFLIRGIISTHASRRADVRHDLPEVYASHVERVLLLVVSRLCSSEEEGRKVVVQKKREERKSAKVTNTKSKKEKRRKETTTTTTTTRLSFAISALEERGEEKQQEQEEEEERPPRKKNVHRAYTPRTPRGSKSSVKKIIILIIKRTIDRDRVTRYPRRLAIVCIFLRLFLFGARTRELRKIKAPISLSLSPFCAMRVFYVTI